jgi:endonuclease/exonuclease/phosphatase (EEP) superfamily protein YafD
MMIHYGHHIFSKLPITYSDVIEVEGGNERIISCRIDVHGMEMDVYGCHLTSNNYNVSAAGHQNVEKLNDSGSLLNYLKGIEAASAQRVTEAETILDSIAASGRCALIIGDMNDICASRPLRIFNKAGFKDAWTEAGIGYGATFHNPLPYRIDHIFFQKNLRLQEIKKIPSQSLSDHDALTAILQIVREN